MWLSSAIEMHGDLYDYSETQNSWVSIKHPILYRCKVHGLVRQDARDHAHGVWCPGCVPNVKRPDVFPVWVKAAQKIFGNRFSYLEAASYANTGGANEPTSFYIECGQHGPFKTSMKGHLASPYGGCRKCQAVGWNAFSTDLEKARHTRVQTFLKSFFKDINIGKRVGELEEVRPVTTSTNSLNKALLSYARKREKARQDEDNAKDRVYAWFWRIKTPGKYNSWVAQWGYYASERRARENATAARRRYNQPNGEIEVKFDCIREGNLLWMSGKSSGDNPTILEEEDLYAYQPEVCNGFHATRWGGSRPRKWPSEIQSFLDMASEKLNDHYKKTGSFSGCYLD